MALTRSLPRRLVFLVPLAVIIYLVPAEFPKVMFLDEFKAMFVFFLAGMLLREYQANLPLLALWFPVTLVFAHVALFVASSCSPGATMWLALNLARGLASIAYLYGLFLQYQRQGRCVELFAIIANHVTPVYLLHTWCMAPVKYVMLRNVGVATTPSFLLSAFVVVGCGVAVPILISKSVFARNVWARRLLLGEGWE